MDTKPARAKRRYLFIPLAIGALLLAGYTVLWFYGAGIMRDEIAGFIEDEQEDGRNISYQKMKIVGYPMALRAQIEDFEWAAPGIWNWAGEKLHIIAMPHDINTLVLAPRGPQAVMVSEDYYTVTPNNLRVGISEDAYSAEVTEMLVKGVGEDYLYIGGFKGNWIAEEDGSWVLGATGSDVSYKETEEKSARLPGFNILISHNPAEGNAFTIDASEIAFDDGSDGPPTLIKLSGTLGIDDAGYPAGTLNVVYRDERKLFVLIDRFFSDSGVDMSEIEDYLRTYRRDAVEATAVFEIEDGTLYYKPLGLGRIALEKLQPVY